MNSLSVGHNNQYNIPKYIWIETYNEQLFRICSISAIALIKKGCSAQDYKHNVILLEYFNSVSIIIDECRSQ